MGAYEVKPTGGGHIEFQYGHHENTKFCVSFNNAGSTPDKRMIQIAKPMFLGAVNPVAASDDM